MVKQFLDGYGDGLNWSRNFIGAAGVALLLAIVMISMKSIRSALANLVNSLRNE